MKDDLISRQQAIDALIKHITPRNNGDGSITVELLTELSIEKILNELPSAQPVWIPCSERLPEKPGQYYVSGGDKVWVCEFLIIPNFIGGWCNNVENPKVQAWMPLPKPYLEGGQDESDD